MQPSDRLPNYVHYALNFLLGVLFVLELVAPMSSYWIFPCLITLAALSSMAALTRQLPLQNVLTAAAITAVIGTLAHSLSALPQVSIPFGPIVFDPSTGQKIFDLIPWTIPLLWIAIVFTARGVVRLALRPWRKTRNYGWWLIGFTALLVTLLDIAMEPFAHLRHFWVWRQTRIIYTWEGATVLDFIGWFCVTLLILAFITPSLIKKQPGSSSTAYVHPLILWLGALLLFAVVPARAGLWLPVVVDALIAAVTLIFAVRGMRW